MGFESPVDDTFNTIQPDTTRYIATDGSFTNVEQCKAVVTAGEWQVDLDGYYSALYHVQSKHLSRLTLTVTA